MLSTFLQAAHPNALAAFEAFAASVLSGKRPAIFLDYDGTLTPIVRDPDAATLAPAMRRVVAALARVFPTAIVSGRGREKVRGVRGRRLRERALIISHL